MGDAAEARWGELMRQAQAGEGNSYRQLFGQLKPVLTNYVMRRVKDVAKTEDIVQSILLRIHMSRDTYDPAKAFAPWMFTIARNLVIDHFRSETRYNASISLVDELPESPAEQEVSADAVRRFDSAYERLSKDQQQAIRLVKMEGKSMEAAAQEAGVSLTAFKVRAHRAYKAFRKALNGDEDE